jgi:large subunit ribosomal protein L6
VLELPAESEGGAGQEKGKNPIIRLESADKQLIGAVAAKIRGFRKPSLTRARVSASWENVRRKAVKPQQRTRK